MAGKTLQHLVNAMPSVSLAANAISFAAADESGPPKLAIALLL
jgi:hypothetical protein